jgi:hypothetical protein
MKRATIGGAVIHYDCMSDGGGMPATIAVNGMCFACDYLAGIVLNDHSIGHHSNSKQDGARRYAVELYQSLLNLEVNQEWYSKNHTMYYQKVG